MKMYTDETNGLVLNITNEGIGFPIDAKLAAMGMAVSPLIHKLTVETSVQSFIDQGKGGHLLTNERPLEDVENPEEPHPYAGLTLDEAIKKFNMRFVEEI